jgi:hypothetical protein
MMDKALIVRIWLWTLVGGIAGAVVTIVGAILFAGYGGTTEWAGPDVVGFTPGPWFWPLVAVMAVGGIAVTLAGIGQFVSWVLALIHTATENLWAWFAVVLALGLVGAGLVGMIAYAIGTPATRPDRQTPRMPHPTPHPTA